MDNERGIHLERENKLSKIEIFLRFKSSEKLKYFLNKIYLFYSFFITEHKAFRSKRNYQRKNYSNLFYKHCNITKAMQFYKTKSKDGYKRIIFHYITTLHVDQIWADKKLCIHKPFWSHIHTQKGGNSTTTTQIWTFFILVASLIMSKKKQFLYQKVGKTRKRES